MANGDSIHGEVRGADGSPLAGAVVYIDDITAPLKHSSQENPILTQKEREFVPRVLPVLIGTTVEFLNQDQELHTIHACDGPESFNFSFAKAGIQRKHTFHERGIYTLLCDVHQQMRATILVLPNPFFAVTDGAGRYEISDVSSGPHSLKAWHETHAIGTRNSSFAGDGTVAFVLTPLSMLVGPKPSTKQPAQAAGKEILDWGQVIARIEETLQRCSIQAQAGNSDEAARLASDAYFACFEARGMETAIRQNISSRRVFLLEEIFAEIRTIARKVSEKSLTSDTLRALNDELIQELKKDAAELGSLGVKDETWDQVAAANSPPEKPAASKAVSLTQTTSPSSLGAIQTSPRGQSPSAPASMDSRLFDEVIAAVESGFEDAFKLSGLGKITSAESKVADTYFDHFHRIEPTLAVQWPARTAELERKFATLRSQIRAGASENSLQQIAAEIVAEMKDLRQQIEQRTNQMWAFVGALLIIVREGFEAILVFVALLAYTQRVGGETATRSVYAGGALAIFCSLAVAAIIAQVFKSVGAARETIEGVSMLLASAVLCYVSCWFIGKAQAQRWQTYLREQVNRSLGRGSLFALGSAAFLAVFREGAETVLFFQALASGREDTAPVWGGLVCGMVVLAVLYVVFRKVTMKISMGVFFGATSLLLYVLAIIFAGQGIWELQEAGWISITQFDFSLSLPFLGLHPTLETLLAQSVLVLIAAVGVALFLRQRQLRTASCSAS